MKFGVQWHDSLS